VVEHYKGIMRSYSIPDSLFTKLPDELRALVGIIGCNLHLPSSL
jgi:hypothetical protein